MKAQRAAILHWAPESTRDACLRKRNNSTAKTVNETKIHAYVFTDSYIPNGSAKLHSHGLAVRARSHNLVKTNCAVGQSRYERFCYPHDCSDLHPTLLASPEKRECYGLAYRKQ